MEPVVIYTRQCRRCGILFVPKDLSGTTANSYRCKKCLGTHAFINDLVYSCVIS